MADTNENGKLSILPMKEERRPLLKDINHFLTCFLCDGYFFNATTIVECAHTYCRACIVKFLKTEKYCPACGAQGHRTKSNPSLRYDAIIQKLVYKTVPGLYQDELLRRNGHLKEAKISKEDSSNGDDRLDENYYFSPDEPISISLEYIDNKIDGHHNDVIKSSEKIEEMEKDQIKHKRYLQCPAKLTIRHIYKFIKLKYNLQRNQEVEVLYDKTKLPGSFSLMDVAYTFSWKRDTPMRLCYQILESITIKVPQTVTEKMSTESVPVKNNFVTNSSSPNNIGNAVQSSNNVHSEETPKTENLNTKVNLKRKLEVVEVTSNTKESTPEVTKSTPTKEEPSKEGPELPGHGLLVKVPRISNTTFKDIMDFKKDGQHEDKPKPTATVSPCTENGLKLPTKSTSSCDDFNDDYMKYEQDIEEVEDDDDDEDDDRLRISHLSEEDTRDDKAEEKCDENLAMETSDVETTTSTTKEDRKEQKLLNGDSKKSAKYKRKSKKSKHSHHHKHRHHERKSKGPPEATIMHSPDTDIMKLKLKLNNVKPDAKYHKQKRKRKKSSECYYSSSFSSSSSVSSVHGMSPDTHSTSRVDEDSLHSHTSELSIESMDTVSSKDEISNKSSQAAEPADKYQSTTTANKEKLLQMRAFRPRNVAVVKPEENHKLEKPVAEKQPKNDNNNNDSTTIVETKEKPKPASPAPVVLRPPSSITVSKITAAEKQKMEQEKLLMMNGNNDDKPSLEIMLVNGPPSSIKSSPKSFVTPAVSSTTDVTSKSKPPQRSTRPPPAAIPIVQYQKMKSNDQTPPNIPKSLTITPQTHRSKSTSNETLKKPKDALSILSEGVKRSVSVSLSGNPSFHNDFNGALDLSSGIKSPKYPADTINVPHTLLNKKICMNGSRQTQNGSRQTQNGSRPAPNGISQYSPVRQLSALADVHQAFHKYPSSPNRAPSSPKHKVNASPPQISSKHIQSRANNTSKPNKTNVPNLNPFKIGPVSSSTEMPQAPKPGPNQTVRHIPNPLIMLQRHQAIVNNIASTPTEYVPIKLPHPNSIMGHRITSNVCSFSSLKKVSDRCPPAIPLQGYLDSVTMATK